MGNSCINLNKLYILLIIKEKTIFVKNNFAILFSYGIIVNGSCTFREKAKNY